MLDERTTPSAQHLVDLAVDAAESAVPLLLEGLGCARTETVRTKSGPTDIVTRFDVAVERHLERVLTAGAPASRVLGEEGGGRGSGPITWIIDPIDGTTNYAAGIPLFAVSIGIVAAGRLVGGCVVDPVREETFAAADDRVTMNGRPLAVRGTSGRAASVVLVGPSRAAIGAGTIGDLEARLTLDHRTVRHLGTSALALAWAAAGRADAVIDAAFHPWDVAAGIALVRAAGGRYVPLPSDEHTAAADWEVPAHLTVSARNLDDEVTLRRAIDHLDATAPVSAATNPW